ncbi:sugar ABC transporter ATP-binding protein, partial [Mesorhizobium sp. M7A.F.Ca.US.014.04.1.1]|uniref:sugar ABC transporter ATP-binding protein n=1 Tax=Mesorhizobium sp. M7A.F.Ca.US.014.04.1.1 TaxID=2496744 RepID=UPI000FD3D137
MVGNAVFRVEGLRKSFGHNEVLGGVSLELHAGEVTVLMGANGAGKSTLVKIISGVYERGGGTMALADQDFAPKTPAEAIRAGVVTVHQNINDGVVADLDVATNLTLDRLSGSGAPTLFNPMRVRREAKTVADRMGLAIDLKARVSDLSLADRQMVAIARALAHKPKVLILDEPTSSLSSAEADRLFALIDRLREQGVAILYISHRMSDIRRLADRIVSMRDGIISGIFDKKPLDYEGAVNAMLGRKIHLDRIVVRDSANAVFKIDGLRIAQGARPISLTLGDGEVVAITGLVGVGKTALAETLFGVRQPLAGTMTLNGRPYAPETAGEAIAAGVFLVAKDRGENGIVGGFNIQENISLPFHKRMSRFAVLKRRLERATARRQIEELGIVCRSEKDEMSELSGGNQQKVMGARWRAQNGRFFIRDEPFQG